jgi:transcriptional/translational regulatory protein YebC/TACO1
LKEDLKLTEDDMMLLALESGAEDLENQDESYEIYTDPAGMQEVRQGILDGGVPIENATVNYIPLNKVEISDIEQAKKVIKLIDTLESHDDVQKVYTNFDLADNLMEEDL